MEVYYNRWIHHVMIGVLKAIQKKLEKKDGDTVIEYERYRDLMKRAR